MITADLPSVKYPNYIESDPAGGRYGQPIDGRHLVKPISDEEMDMLKGFHIVVVQRMVIRPDITSAANTVLQVLRSGGSKHQWSYEKLFYWFRDDSSVSKSSIRRSVKELKTVGILTITPRKTNGRYSGQWWIVSPLEGLDFSKLEKKKEGEWTPPSRARSSSKTATRKPKASRQKKTSETTALTAADKPTKEAMFNNFLRPAPRETNANVADEDCDNYDELLELQAHQEAAETARPKMTNEEMLLQIQERFDCLVDEVTQEATPIAIRQTGRISTGERTDWANQSVHCVAYRRLTGLELRRSDERQLVRLVRDLPDFMQTIGFLQKMHDENDIRLWALNALCGGAAEPPSNHKEWLKIIRRGVDAVVDFKVDAEWIAKAKAEARHEAVRRFEYRTVPSAPVQSLSALRQAWASILQSTDLRQQREMFKTVMTSLLQGLEEACSNPAITQVSFENVAEVMYSNWRWEYAADIGDLAASLPESQINLLQRLLLTFPVRPLDMTVRQARLSAIAIQYQIQTSDRDRKFGEFEEWMASRGVVVQKAFKS